MGARFRDLFSLTRVISGDVLTAHVHVETQDDGPSSPKFWGLLEDNEQSLKHEIEIAIRENLGSAFELRKVALARGSIEIIVIVGTAYYAVSRYKNFVESIELFVSQLESVVRRFFQR